MYKRTYHTYLLRIFLIFIYNTLYNLDLVYAWLYKELFFLQRAEAELQNFYEELFFYISHKSSDEA